MLRSAPFETPPAAAPQDRLAHLEARTTPGQLPQPSASAGRGACRLFGGLQPLLRPRFRPRFDRSLANRRLLDEPGVAEEACDPIGRQRPDPQPMLDPFGLESHAIGM